MIRQRRYQRGISITAVLGIMVAVTILALAFLGMVRFQIKDTAFEQATITSAYIAEIGFHQIRAELADTNGEWSLLNGIVKDCEPSDPFHARCQRIPATDNFADFRVVRENPLDPDSPIIGIYEVGIETGQKRAIFGNQTLTGSTVGYVPGSVLPSEQIGYDMHGNKLCDESVAEGNCPGNFVGVRVKAWLTDAQGNLIPNTRSQTIYGVLQMDSRNPDDDGPSSFMLESHQDIIVASNSEWNGSTGLIEPQGGFYGPMHTNNKYTFQWDSSADDPDIPGNVDIVRRRTFGSIRQTPPNYNSQLGPRLNDTNFAGDPHRRDELGLLRPFLGVLMAHRNNVDATNKNYGDLCTPRLLSPPKMYFEKSPGEPNPSYEHVPYFLFSEINWKHEGWTKSNPSPSRPSQDEYYEAVFTHPVSEENSIVRIRRGFLDADRDIIPNPFYCNLTDPGLGLMKTVPSDPSNYLPTIDSYDDINAILDSYTFSCQQGPKQRFESARISGLRKRIAANNYDFYMFDVINQAKIRSDSSVEPETHAVIWTHGTLDWVHAATPTQKPNDNYHYCVRYIDHSTINIHESMSYSGNSPDFRYWHEHPAGESMFSLNQAAHGHPDIMGAELAANSVSGDPGYDGGTWRHSHHIVNSNQMFNSTLNKSGIDLPNTFIRIMNRGSSPSFKDAHVVPLLMPTPDLDQYKNQMEQLNKYLVLTLGVTLPRDSTDTLDGSALGSAPFNSSDYNRGYLVGKFPSDTTHGSVMTNKLTPAIRSTQPIVDFRAVYFGNDLRYSAGASAGQRVLPEESAYDETAYIWVNDNPEDPDYMKVASSPLSAEYRHYLYRQIPPSKVILARDAVVLVGNMRPQTANCEFLNASCLDYHPGHVAQQPGRATIVNGQLTIVSFTTTVAPSQPDDVYHHYNLGDIVVAGNVLYHNDFYALPTDKTQMRQLATQPVSPYVRSNGVNGPISNIDDSQVMWITNTDGTRYRNPSGSFVGTLDGLGLFAVNDIKLSVTGYFHASGYNHEKNKANSGELMRIHGQLIAGKKIAVHRDDRGLSSGEKYFSNIDKLEIFGTVYSYQSPDFSSYFKVRREYYFDKSLKMNPLVGAPYYPESEYAYRDQTIFSQFPRLVQGTWTQSLD